MHDAPSFQLLSDNIFLFMIHPLFCFCAFLHKPIRLTLAIANLLQFAATLQFRLQTFRKFVATLQFRLQTSCKLQQPCNPDCRLPAICGDLTIPIANLLYLQKRVCRSGYIARRKTRTKAQMTTDFYFLRYISHSHKRICGHPLVCVFLRPISYFNALSLYLFLFFQKNEAAPISTQPLFTNLLFE